MSQKVKGHLPEDFDWILVQFNQVDIRPIIVAGQAVNIWGKTFRPWDAKFNPTKPRIEDLLPLTSDDLELLEFKGVSALGKFKGVVDSDKSAPFAKAASPDSATYHLKNAAGVFKVQILTWLPGASREMLTKYSVPIKLGANKALVRVPDPVILLSCKIANLATLSQTNPVRNDHKHVQILMCCIRALIGTRIQKETPPHDVLKIIARFNKTIATKDARKVTKKYQLDWESCLPLDLIDEAAKTDKVWQNYCKHQTRRP